MCCWRVAQARAQGVNVNVNEVITTYTVVASAFLGAVVFVNGRTQHSVDELKKDVADMKNDMDGKFADLKKDAADTKKDVDDKFADLKKDVDGKFSFSFIVSLATLATVLYMAAVTAAPFSR